MGQVKELLFQALETEQGGIQVYETAIRCAKNADLRREWGEYLTQTRRHEEILREVLHAGGMDAEEETPGRIFVRHTGQALVGTMSLALRNAPKAAAEIVAAECVVLAETKDHMNWELIGEVCGLIPGALGESLKAAHDEVEAQEDEHLYHTTGWTRELWLSSLGLPAVLPPPEEVKDVKSAIGAARAKQDRQQMIPRKHR